VFFTARNTVKPEHTVHMGGALEPGAAHFRVELANLHYPWRLHILKNGFHFEIVKQLSAAATQMVEFHDQADGGDYYRLELHAVPPYSDVPSQRWREWQTLLAFANPIFVDVAA
jgi:hypothetical protein